MIDSQLIQWGIIGPGRIASQVIKDFPYVPGAQALAVASRSLARAQAFASEHGLARAYGSYQEIMNDPDVDAVYISTPHPQHHAIALAAIAAGKAVLVEKTFTATVAGAEQIIAAAHRREVFAMEAMWTRFQPAIVAARAEFVDELAAKGAQLAGNEAVAVFRFKLAKILEPIHQVAREANAPVGGRIHG